MKITEQAATTANAADLCSGHNPQGQRPLPVSSFRRPHFPTPFHMTLNELTLTALLNKTQISKLINPSRPNGYYMYQHVLG